MWAAFVSRKCAGCSHGYHDYSRRTHAQSRPISLRPFASPVQWCCPGCSRSLLVTVSNIGPTAALNPIDFYRIFWQCFARLRGVLPCTPTRHPVLLSLFPLDHNLVLHGKVPSRLVAGTHLFDRCTMRLVFPAVCCLQLPRLCHCAGQWRKAPVGVCVGIFLRWNKHGRSTN